MSEAGERSLRIIIIAGVVLLGSALRLYRLGDDPFWFDEIASLQDSSGHGCQTVLLPTNRFIDYLVDTVHLSNARPLSQVWATAMDHDLHPPLYYITLRIWRDLFGDGEFSVRLPGLIGSIVGIGLCAAVGAELFDFASGFWAAMLMAAAAPQIYFAHEARGYLTFPTWCLLAAYAILRIERGQRSSGTSDRIKKRWPLVLGVSSLAAMLTHYFSAMPLFVIAIYALINLRGSSRRWALSAMVVAGLVFVGAWGPHVLRQREIVKYDVIGSERGESGLLWILQTLPLTIVRELTGTEINDPKMAVAVAIIVAASELIALAFAIRRNSRPQLLCHAWMLLSLGAIGVSDLVRKTEFLGLLRYILVAAPAVFLLIAGTLHRHRILRHLIPAIAVCVCFIGWPRAYASWRGEWREYARDISAARKPGDYFVFIPLSPNIPDLRIYGTQFYVDDFHGPAAVLTKPADSQLLRRLAQANSIWLILESGVREPPMSYLPLTGRAQFHQYQGVGDVYHVFPDRPSSNP